MITGLKKRLSILAYFQIFILIISYLTIHRVTLLSYINISFYVSSALMFTSLLIYTIRTGFFDAISKSFNFLATRGKDRKSIHDVPALSEMVTINQKPLFFYGFFTGLFMLIALFFYYL